MLSGARAPRLWLAVAAACLCASLAAQGGRWSVALDLFTEAAPLWFAGSTLAAVAAAGARPGWRPILLAAAGLGLMAAGVLLAPELARPAPGARAEPGAPTLRIIQINIGGSGLARPDEAAAVLARLSPDLIFVDDPDAALTTALEQRGFRWSPGADLTGIASRLPLRASPVVFSAHDWRTMPDMARARLPTRDGPVDLIAVHLKRPFPASSPERIRSGVACLEDLTHRYDRRRLIVAGDLNLTPWSFALRRLDRTLGLERRDRAAFTWPAKAFGLAWPAPLAPLDHLYAGPAWRTVKVAVGPPIDATHYPLIVDLAAHQSSSLRRPA